MIGYMFKSRSQDKLQQLACPQAKQLDSLPSLSKLSMDRPEQVLSTIAELHQQLCHSLEAALAVDPTNAADQQQLSRQFAAITGISKSDEATWYIQQAGGDLKAAAINWHNEVLRSYLTSFQARFPGVVSYPQHQRIEEAKAMRAKAAKAADAAASFPTAMAQGYLIANLQSICGNVERRQAEALLQQAAWNICAAVDCYIKDSPDIDQLTKQAVLSPPAAAGGLKRAESLATAA